MPDTDYPVQNNREKSRFEVMVDGHLARADYELEDGLMRMTHTVVDPALEGKGIAAALVRAAFAHAREHHLKIDPQCPYVHSYMERHPETRICEPDDAKSLRRSMACRLRAPPFRRTRHVSNPIR